MYYTSRKAISIILALSILFQIVQMSVYAVDFTDKEDSVVSEVDTESPYSTDKEPRIVCEIEEKRTEYSKEYLLEDGSFCSISSSNPIHILAHGKWNDVVEFKGKENTVDNVLNRICSVGSSFSDSKTGNERSEIIEDSSSSLVFNWKNTRSIIGGKHELSYNQYFAVKPDVLQYYLSKNILVLSACISANCSVSVESETCAYEVTSSWTSNDNSIPSFESNNVLANETLSVSQEIQSCSWDITDLYSRWDRGVTINNGLVIKNNSVNGKFNVRNPCLVIQYIEIDSNDIDFTYHSNDMNKAGIVYVNDATNILRVDQELISLKYANYEFKVTRNYNSGYDSPFENPAGIGMKFNYESEISLSTEYAKWEMPNGNTTKFVPSSPLLVQGDYQLWTSLDNTGNHAPQLWVKTSEITGFTSTGDVTYSNIYVVADNLKYTFYDEGRLSAIKENATGNNIFSLDYVNNRLYTVTSSIDGSFLEFGYDYDENIDEICIKTIVAKNSSNTIIDSTFNVSFSTELINNDEEVLSSVQFGDGCVCKYVYDDNGRLLRVEDEQGNACDINYATNVGYDSPPANHITGYSLYRDNESMPYDSVLINKENTYLRTFTYSDGKSDSIGYDKQFRVRVYKDIDGEYKCINYGEDNTYFAMSGDNEFVENNGFDDNNGLATETEPATLDGLDEEVVINHWNISLDDSGLINTSNAHSKSGNALMFTSNEPLTLFASQEIIENGTNKIFEADKTYVVGGWVYTTNNILGNNNEIGILIEAASVDGNTIIGNITDSDYSEIGFIQFDNTIHDSWQYKLMGFKLEENSVVRICLQYNNQKNAVYFDDITMFESGNSDLDLEGMLISNPIEYTYNNHLVSEESVTWERENEDDIYMSASYSYDENKLQEYIDYNGNPTYYEYDETTELLSGMGHTVNDNTIVDIKSLEYDAPEVLKSVEQVIKDVETNNDVTLCVEYDNAFGRVEKVTHNGYSHVFEYNADRTLAETHAYSVNAPSGNNDEYQMEYTYSNGELSVIDYSNNYRIKYLTGSDNQGNMLKTISCYSVDGLNETLIKSYIYTYDEDNNLSSVYDDASGLTITYTSDDLSTYEISDYGLLYQKDIESDGAVSENIRQRNYNTNYNTDFDTVETSRTVVSYNSDGTRNYSSSISIDKNTYYMAGINHTKYYQGYYDYDRESVRDYFGRVASKTIDETYQRDYAPGNLSTVSEYEYKDLGNGRTSGLVSEYSQSFYKQTIENDNPVISNTQTVSRKYEYDNKGNISFVYDENGNSIDPKQYYEYDNANQVITEINFEKQISAHYTYNAGGNLTAKIYYNFSGLSFNVSNRQIISFGPAIRRITYQYDSVWKDRVVTYSDTGFTDDNIDDSVYETITYDKMGNPLKYVGEKIYGSNNPNLDERSLERMVIGDLEWNGNRLVSFETTKNKYVYNYDANGYRTSKIIFNKTLDNNENIVYEESSIIDYIWNNGVLSSVMQSGVDSLNQRANTQSATIIYDQEGAPAGIVTMAGVPYLFKKDMNENVLSLVYTNGNDICSLKYDSWGTPRLTLYGDWAQQLVALGTVLLCPSTYHGYLYDFESGLYFNQGRCYSPSWGRYISPESPESLTYRSDNPLDSNLYLFCNNNTVNNLDIVGSWSRDYTEVEWQANGFDIKMNEIFASRSMCMLVANELIKKYGKWYPEYGYALFEMNSLRIASDLFAHYIGKTATAAINKVNACWGDGWILSNKKSDIIKVRNNDSNDYKYERIWRAAPEIKVYAQKEGIFIAL